MYTAVGARWWWYSRLSWDYARWLAYLDRPDLETWVAYVSGTPAGYFELERQDGAVWVHTCTLDPPQALANYQGRGFRIVRSEERMVELPAEALQPWPSANLVVEDRDA